MRGQCAGLSQGRVTHHAGRRQVPAVQLLIAELVAKDLGVVPEGPAHELARRSPNISRCNSFTKTKSKARLEGHYTAQRACSWSIEDFHKLSCTVLRAGRADGLTTVAGAGPSVSQPGVFLPEPKAPVKPKLARGQRRQDAMLSPAMGQDTRSHSQRGFSPVARRPRRRERFQRLASSADKLSKQLSIREHGLAPG